MAVELSLSILDAKEETLIGRHSLYFGKALQGGSWSGWDWVKNQGMTVDGPWTLDNDDSGSNFEISKHKL